MNRVIFKYQLDPASGGQYAIPRDSRFLALQMQDDVPTMWWSVPAVPEPRQDWPLRTFSVAPTGPPGYTDNLHYVGTFQIGGFVGHVLSWEPVPR